MTDEVTNPVSLETSPPTKLSRKIVIDLSESGLTYQIDDALTLWEVLGAFDVVGDNLRNVSLAQNRDVLIAINNKIDKLLNSSSAPQEEDSGSKLITHLLSEIEKFKT